MTQTDWSAAGLESLAPQERLARLPRFVGALVAAAGDLGATRVWLFGSRARGDQVATSDVDLAFEIPTEHHDAWVRFAVEAPEAAETLLELNLVAMHQAGTGLRQRILREGVVLLER